MAALTAEMVIKITPKMTEEGKELVRQMIREEIFRMQQERQLEQQWQGLIEQKPAHLDFEVKG